jgi:hypothetical protein
MLVSAVRVGDPVRLSRARVWPYFPASRVQSMETGCALKLIVI